MRFQLQRIVTGALLASSWIVIAEEPSGRASKHDTDTVEYAPAKFCELILHPKEYDGQSVAVRASYRYGFEWQEIFGMRCRNEAKTWLEFDAVSPALRRALGKAPRHQGTINATFYGTFHGSGGRYGDGGYAFKFDATSIRSVQIISRDGWAPDRLSVEEQQRLCKGDELPAHSGK
jgi:hypothetical protein